MKKITVALIFGGKSGEHEVSLRSAASVYQALNPEKYRVVPIGITKEGQWRVGTKLSAGEFQKILEAGQRVVLPAEPEQNQFLQFNPAQKCVEQEIHIDVAFPVLHGPFGEDGTIQGLLEMANLPYVGAGVLGSSAGMDKDVMKRLLLQAGIPTPAHLCFLDTQWMRNPDGICLNIEEKLGYPCFVKPANLGSSVGISKAKNQKHLREAIEVAAAYDRKIIVEQFIHGREIECSVLGNEDPQASIPGEIIPSREFYDYESKYIDDKSELIIPAPLTPDQTRRVQELAVRTFLATECAGMARVDFFVEKPTGEVVVNEINTIPGFTSISMYPKLWEASGISVPQLIDRLIELAVERHARRQAKKTAYR